jgi:hypothetical protein
MKVVNVDGRLCTTGGWAETAEAEANQAQALAEQRAELRRMLEGNVQFFDDPMAAEVVTVSDGKRGQLAAASGAALVGTKPDAGRALAVGDLVEVMPHPAGGHGWPWVKGPMDDVIGKTGKIKEFVTVPGGTTYFWVRGAGWENAYTACQVRLLPAKPAALPGWRRGPDVPESERQSGLWFVRASCYTSVAVPPDGRVWMRDYEYRPAPPGVREGDAYSPALYGEEA